MERRDSKDRRAQRGTSVRGGWQLVRDLTKGAWQGRLCAAMLWHPECHSVTWTSRPYEVATATAPF